MTFPVATSDTWKDRSTGERRERTEWHLIAIYNEALGRLASAYLKKGDQVYLEGKMETRKWRDQSGQDRYTTEVALRPYAGEMTFLGSSQSKSGQQGPERDRGNTSRRREEYPDRGGDGRHDPEDPSGRVEAAPNAPPADLYSHARGFGYGGSGRVIDDDIPF